MIQSAEATDLTKFYKTMRMIRRFEERVVELVNRNEIPGVTHEYVGEEAVAAGVCHALRPDDVITSTLAFAVFHVMFWRLFSWKEDLESLSYVNRAIMKTQNVVLIYLFVLFGAISLAIPQMLLHQTLGRVLLAGLAGFWAVRTVAQIVIFRLGKPISLVLTVIFIAMTVGYVVVLG